MVLKRVLLGLVGWVVWAPWSLAQTREAVSVELPERVELAMIVAVISDLDPDGQMIRPNGPYVEAVEARFSSYADHAVFDALGADFNLPRLAGNAADFAFNEDGDLIETDGTGSIWGIGTAIYFAGTRPCWRTLSPSWSISAALSGLRASLMWRCSTMNATI